MTGTDRSDWPEAMATVLSCHYETRAGRALAFGLPSSRRFHITYNYWAQGELQEADCYSAKAVPQGSLFPIRYDPETPLQHHHAFSETSPPGTRIRTLPLLAIGVCGSVVLSLAWLLLMRGCQ